LVAASSGCINPGGTCFAVHASLAVAEKPDDNLSAKGSICRL